MRQVYETQKFPIWTISALFALPMLFYFTLHFIDAGSISRERPMVSLSASEEVQFRYRRWAKYHVADKEESQLTIKNIPKLINDNTFTEVPRIFYKQANNFLRDLEWIQFKTHGQIYSNEYSQQYRDFYKAVDQINQKSYWRTVKLFESIPTSDQRNLLVHEFKFQDSDYAFLSNLAILKHSNL